MPNPKDQAQLRDDLDTALDRFSVSGESSSAPAWLGVLNEQLTDLDDAFASPSEMGRLRDRILRDSSLVESLSSPRAAQQEVPAARRLPLNGWLMAAVLAIVALGLFGADRVWWSDQDERPTGASIAAVSASPATSYVEEFVVTPSACTFKPLTRSQYDEIIGTSTPVTEEGYDNLQVAMTNELLPALDLRVVNGAVSINGGGPVPKEIADEIASVLSSYMACGNSGDLPAAFRIFSDEFIARLPDRDQFLVDIESPPTPEVIPLSELHVSQMRLLPDGRIVLVWGIDPLSSPEIEFSPEPTPDGTVALDGVLLVFVKVADEWKLDFQRGGENFQLQLKDKDVPLARASASNDEFVVTPSTCTLEPLTLERYDAIVGSATPLSSSQDYDRMLDEKVEELVPALEMKLINGIVVITGGSAVEKETRVEVGELLSSFIACGNEGDYLARLGFFSDGFVKAISRESILEVFSGTPIAVETILADMRFQQMRLLDDGRLIVVWSDSPSVDTQGETGIPPSTPGGTVALDGEVMVFVMTPDGWRFEFGQSGDHFQVSKSEQIGTPVP